MAMAMAKNIRVYVLMIIGGLALSCNAATYIVGDTSGWDISTDLDSWSQGKRFYVGDVLVFQYSSSQSLNEVTRENYNTCNTTNVLKAYTNGNTTVTLSQPGQRFFVSGNRLLCLGGMKMQVNVENNQSFSPAAAPQPPPQSNSLPRPSSKTDNDGVPSGSTRLVIGGKEALGIVFACYVISLAFI
ncbi:Uclacyanin 1, partial [Cucurbita argyrosperma subsp. sororia]